MSISPLKVDFHLYVCVLCVCQCLWRSEEDAKPRVPDCFEAPGVLGTRVLWESSKPS